MKLLVQADDFGMTYGITDGICLAARYGILTCTGLMSNFECSNYAANRIKEFTHVSVGQDINFFAGKSVSDPCLVPHLVDEKGYFLSSEERKKVDGFPKVDPFPFEETILEVENQVKKFIELMGRKPAYIQGHSYLTENLSKAIIEVAKKYDITYTLDKWQKMKMYNCNWLAKDDFTFEKQLNINVEEGVFSQLDDLSKNEKSFIVCHAGYLDEDLFSKSTYTAIRYKDLEMLLSTRIKNYIEDNQIELVNYESI